MKKEIKLLKYIILFTIFLLNNSKAELTNKVIISVGSEIITNYDLANEIKYLDVITAGQFKKIDNKESRENAIDSLMKLPVTFAFERSNILPIIWSAQW